MSGVCQCGKRVRISFVSPESFYVCGSQDDCGCDVGLVKDPTDSFGWRDSINAIVRDVYDRIEAMENKIVIFSQRVGMVDDTVASVRALEDHIEALERKLDADK